MRREHFVFWMLSYSTVCILLASRKPFNDLPRPAGVYERSSPTTEYAYKELVD